MLKKQNSIIIPKMGQVFLNKFKILLARYSTPKYLPKKNKNAFLYDEQHKLIPIVYLSPLEHKKVYHIVNV